MYWIGPFIYYLIRSFIFSDFLWTFDFKVRNGLAPLYIVESPLIVQRSLRSSSENVLAVQRSHLLVQNLAFFFLDFLGHLTSLLGIFWELWKLFLSLQAVPRAESWCSWNWWSGDAFHQPIVWSSIQEMRLVQLVILFPISRVREPNQTFIWLKQYN